MRKWLPLLAVSLGSFMLLVDVTIVNVALPDMADDLSSSFSSLQWVIDAYALVLAALLLGFGSLSDTIGHRRTYGFGLVLFTVASVACGTAVDPGMLIAARAVQGIGGAAMFATTFGLLHHSYDGRDLDTSYGIWGAVSGAAAAIGPILGGVLTQTISWRWIFLVNAPVGLVTLLLTLAFVPADRATVRRRLDLCGLVTFTLAAALLTFALTRTSTDGWGSPVVLTCLAVAVLAFVTFVGVERRVNSPMIDLTLFRRRMFSGTVVAAFVLSFAGFGAITYATIWTQTVLGLSPIESGLVCIPLPILSATFSTLSGRWMHRLSRPAAIGGGMLLIGVGCLLIAWLVAVRENWVALLPGLAVIGAGCGISVPIMSATATHAAGTANAGIASGAINTARQLGQALGIALLGSLATSVAVSSLRDAGVGDANATANQLVGGGARRLVAEHPGIARALGDAFGSGLGLDYLVCGVLGVVVAGLTAWLVRADRSDGSTGSGISDAAADAGRAVAARGGSGAR